MAKSEDIEPVISHPPTTTDSFGGGAGGADPGGITGGAIGDTEHRGSFASSWLSLAIVAAVFILLVVVLVAFLR